MSKDSEYQRILLDFLGLSAAPTDELIAEILRLLKKRSYKKGDYILKMGEVERNANIVVKGIVHQYVFDEEEQKTINITPRGLSFNSLKSYLGEQPSVEIQEALTDVEIIYLTKDDIETLAQRNPQFSYLMFKLYEKILYDRENRMFLLQNRNPSKRLRLFHENVERANLILQDTPDKYIASYLNMNPQQYSNEKKKMLKQGR
ncbi:Crp/Fnr family transcriptional regulator [Geofilum rhodophaeum]|uniref:Crp/Fnr family transcriptional regulator n=1 Tax=Geofilum rhodophaeum TaxID=1965019 RepID=UPI00131477D6|nr:Crp/Fnr family transcriptional regulator [Geofilum rhodophaeum]